MPSGKVDDRTLKIDEYLLVSDNNTNVCKIEKNGFGMNENPVSINFNQTRHALQLDRQQKLYFFKQIQNNVKNGLYMTGSHFTLLHFIL